MLLYKWKNCRIVLFLFCQLSLPVLNVLKLIHNTYYHKTRINLIASLLLFFILCPFITLYNMKAGSTSMTHGHIPHLLLIDYLCLGILDCSVIIAGCICFLNTIVWKVKHQRLWQTISFICFSDCYTNKLIDLEIIIENLSDKL